jgi:hypothetical protein
VTIPSASRFTGWPGPPGAGLLADYYQTLTNNRNAPILVKDYFYSRELLETEFPDKVFPKQSFGKRGVDIFDPQFEKRPLFGMMLPSGYQTPVW